MQIYHLLILILIFSRSLLQAQEVYVVQHGTEADSSYYDIFRINDNEFWAAGKYGILTSIDTLGNVKPVQYPNRGSHLLQVTAFDDENILISADKGGIYLYNKEKNTWKFDQLEGFSNKSFYSAEIINENTAFICGGSSKVSFGKKSLPLGFIIKTSDKGESWETIYSNPLYMIWDLMYDSKSNKIYAILYSIFGSKLIYSDADNIQWKSISIDPGWLYHHISFDKDIILSGTKKSNIKGDGALLNVDQKISTTFDEIGMIWSIMKNNAYDIYTASMGNVIWKKKEEKIFHTISTPVKYNLYKAAFIDERSFYMIGSNRSIVKIVLPDTDRTITVGN